MKKCFIKNKLLSFTILIAIWWILSLFYPPIVIPRISSVLKSIGEIILSEELRSEIYKTFFRLLMGILFGAGFGAAVGFFCGMNKTMRSIFSNFIKILQVVPPVSILILTIIWLGYNGKPAIAITAVAVFPTIVISVQDSILNLDKKLMEMAKIFQFSKFQKIKFIIWPSVKPQVYSGLKIALGTASKTVVMGEVLTTVTGIGGQIVNARLNVESEKIIAWTVVSVAMYFVFDRVSALLFGTKTYFRLEAEKSGEKKSAENSESKEILQP